MNNNDEAVKLEILHSRLSYYMEKISENFTRDCKLTLIIRKSGNSEATLILSDDEKEKVVKAMRTFESDNPSASEIN